MRPGGRRPLPAYPSAFGRAFAVPRDDAPIPFPRDDVRTPFPRVGARTNRRSRCRAPVEGRRSTRPSGDPESHEPRWNKAPPQEQTFLGPGAAAWPEARRTPEPRSRDGEAPSDHREPRPRACRSTASSGRNPRPRAHAVETSRPPTASGARRVRSESVRGGDRCRPSQSAIPETPTRPGSLERTLLFPGGESQGAVGSRRRGEPPDPAQSPRASGESARLRLPRTTQARPPRPARRRPIPRAPDNCEARAARAPDRFAAPPPSTVRPRTRNPARIIPAAGSQPGDRIPEPANRSRSAS